jgi:hypothetical protein
MKNYIPYPVGDYRRRTDVLNDGLIASVGSWNHEVLSLSDIS